MTALPDESELAQADLDRSHNEVDRWAIATTETRETMCLSDRLLMALINFRARESESAHAAVVMSEAAADYVAQIDLLRKGLRQIAEGDYPAEASNGETWASEVLDNPLAVNWEDEEA